MESIRFRRDYWQLSLGLKGDDDVTSWKFKGGENRLVARID